MAVVTLPVPLSPWSSTYAEGGQQSSRLQCAIRGRAVAGIEKSTGIVAWSLGAAASAMVERYAPGAPQALKDEAVIRFAGYLAQADFGGFRSEGQGVGGTPGPEYVTNHAPAFRNCGAAMLLTPWRVRRAGRGRLVVPMRSVRTVRQSDRACPGRRGDSCAVCRRFGPAVVWDRAVGLGPGNGHARGEP